MEQPEKNKLEPPQLVRQNATVLDYFETIPEFIESDYIIKKN